MSSRRLLKAGEAIRGVVSMAILTELRDPRVKNVTVLGVELMPDMREAKVFVSVMGSEIQQRTALRGLQNSAGFLQSRIADRIETRYTPKLIFVADEGVKKSLAVSKILDQIATEQIATEQIATEQIALGDLNSSSGDSGDAGNDTVNASSHVPDENVPENFDENVDKNYDDDSIEDGASESTIDNN